ncbi:glycosyltransferase [Actinomadura kijaniata]|uniref:Vancomycin aglycone glucosyltransferase n=1 Tax=Actinomadura namibiensis TaxID=182080 RepID=A0A7W3LSX3_ACTNM|nr:glycosyltransferase [Actinomadura namibiensis]MBA8953690.1 vancomycin aglycone glucosyltransferase [Actinomadura namibiensis]
MRVVLSTYGSRGDVEPMVAFAVRLRERGAHVRVCAPPDEDFARRLEAVGVPLVPFGPSARALTTGAPPPTRSATSSAGEMVARRSVELADGQRAVLREAAEGCDALVATGVPAVVGGARSVAEKLGVPWIHVTFQQLTLPSPYRAPLAYPGQSYPPEVTDVPALWKLHDRHMNALFGEAINTNRAALGLPPVDDVASFLFGARNWLASDPVLDPWRGPADLDVVQTGAWFLPDDRPLPDDLRAFLDAGEPPVYVGFGSMPMKAATDLSRAVVEAVRAHGRRAVVMRGWADLSAVDGRDDCLVVGEVNHQALFPRVAAVVHHGGAGTTTTAARAGAPQVVVAQGADQPYWAGRVAGLGIGTVHDGPAPTAESLASALKAALAPGTAERAAAVAEEARTDGASLAAELLVERLG